MSDEITLLPRLSKSQGENKIRILVILPSKNRNALLKGQNGVQTLAKKDDIRQAPHSTPYSALLYCWGDSAEPMSTALDTRKNGVHLTAQSAMQKIRLWMKACLIDHDDTQDWHSRAEFIAHVYSELASVIFWLDKDVDISYDLGRPFGLTSDREYEVTGKELAESYALGMTALVQFFGRLYTGSPGLVVLLQEGVILSADFGHSYTGESSSMLHSDRMLHSKQRDLRERASELMLLREHMTTQSQRIESAFFWAQHIHDQIHGRSFCVRPANRRRKKSIILLRDDVSNTSFRASKDAIANGDTLPHTREIGKKLIATEGLEISRGSDQTTKQDMTMRGYKMFWTCVSRSYLPPTIDMSCGYKGLDHYIEYRSGSVRELLQNLHDAGIHAHMEPWDPLRPGRAAMSLAFARLLIVAGNLHGWILASTMDCIRSYLVIWFPKAPTTTFQSLSDIAKDKLPHTETTAGQTPNAYIPTTTTSSQNNVTTPSLLSSGTSSVSSTNTNGQFNQSISSSTACTGSNQTHVNIREDFILLCMKVKKFLTSRYDVGVSGITCDRELFQAFRNEYNSKFGRIYRRFSLRTAQRMSFVKFVLHPRSEVDGLMADMPPDTVKHYTCDPRKPDHIPAIGSDILMHRFTSPGACFDDKICLNQMPKRIGERPTPGIDPDFYTGWGMHIEEGLNFERICFILFFGIVSGGTFGIVWAICKKSLQDGFAVAGFIVGTEAIAVASLQLLLAFETR